MLATTHSVFHDWVTYIGIISGIAVAWVSLYFMYVRPLMRDREKERTERVEQRAITKAADDAFIHGLPAMAGMRQAIPPAAIRMQAVENELHENTEAIKRMAEWQREANGTGRETRRLVEETRNLVSGLVAAGVLIRETLDAQDAREAKLQGSLDAQDESEKKRGNTSS